MEDLTLRRIASTAAFERLDLKNQILNIFPQVLFPLLDKVKKLSSSASDNKDPTEENLLIHHSRDTAEKQWAETRVLTLAGVARVFNTKRKILQQLGKTQRKDKFNLSWAVVEAVHQMGSAEA